MGGIARRATVIKGVEQEGGEVILLGLWDFSGRPDAQGRSKSEVSLKAMKEMDYDALVLGERELSLGADDIFTKVLTGGIPLLETTMT